MKKSLLLLIFSVLLTSYTFVNKPTPIFNIPTQTLNLYKLLNDNSSTINQTVKAFQISELITYKEYKDYLSSVKKDSSDFFYLTQLPDSSIGSIEVWRKYITGSDYDNFPVLGISWDNAMNYCKWKTLKENKDSIQFIYRLPNCSEWLAAYSYLLENKIKNDFNKNYSDWLLNTKDESPFVCNNNPATKPFFYDYIYFHHNKDWLVKQRKLVIGNSYLYQQEHLLAYSFSFYANEGYRQIGFRYIKESVKQSDKVYPKGDSFAIAVLKYWNLKIK